MPNTKDMKVDKVKAVVYGDSGVGKTVFAGTWPSPFVADFDEGLLSLRGKDVEYETFVDRFRRGVRYESGWRSFTEVFEDIEQGKKEVGTLVVDSITMGISTLLMDIAALNNHKVPQWEDYGKAVEPLLLFFKRLRALPVHVLLLAHEELVKVEATGELLYRPLLFGKKLGPQLQLLFDEVYRMTITGTKKGMERVLITQSTGRTSAKSRLLEEREIPPTFQEIENRIK